MSERVIPTHRIFWVAGRSILVSSTIVTGLFLGLQRFGVVESLDLAIFDRFVQIKPDAPPDPRLLLVAITEQDLQRYGWPLSDQILAQALQKIQLSRPRVIGIDLYRDLPKPPGAIALAEQLRAKNVIVITEIVGNIAPPPNVEPERVGFNDLTLDIDGVLRRNLMFVPTSDAEYYSFGLRLTLAYWQQEGITFRYNPEAIFFGDIPLIALKSNSGGYQRADTNGYQILLDYRARKNIVPSVSLSQILDGNIDPNQIQDKIVLIGTTAPSLKDLFLTPYSSAEKDTFRMPGVIIHAQMTRQLLEIASGSNSNFSFWSQWAEMLWLWTWTVIGGIVVWKLRHPLAFGVAGMLCLVVIGGTGWLLFSQLIWIPVAEPALGCIFAISLAITHRLLYTTTRDSFTGLLNKEALLRYIKKNLAKITDSENNAKLAVMFLQLDRFQLIRESLGTFNCDRLLLTIIKRFQKILPRSAKLTRISEDEFAIAVDHSQSETLTILADQLQNGLKQPFFVNQQELIITASIGIAITQERHLHTPENLLRDAHTAMYRAKTLGKARHEVFAAGMLQEAVAQFVLENELRQAIINREFVLYYQPLINFETGNIAGFEALIRWQHPKKGLVSPFFFISLAEETGLIIPLGEWIFEEACHQAHQWQQQFPDLNLIFSVNLSGRQFEQPDLIEMLDKIIKKAQIKENSLKIEITESMLMGDVEAAIDLMLRIKSLGCKLGMDDFGTGYSSLSQLRRFPIDTLKVDQSFVRKMGTSKEDYEIVRMIISLGHILGMDIIAEGVETKEDADALKSLNCEFGQGYFWAKPLPVDEATKLLEAESLKT